VPCAIKLCENIIFNPDNGDLSNTYFEPEFSHKKERYTSMGYTLGFFAAIAIESSNIVIELNNFSIRQSNKHYLFQRFYSHIELAGQPFIPKQGPANFGNIIKTGDNLTVQNGKLGRTSHHCIHGNNNKNVDILRVHFCNFEVAAIALNACCSVNIKYCDIDGDIRDVPVLGIFSAAMFLRKFAKMAIESSSMSESAKDIKDKLSKLEVAIRRVEKDVCSTVNIGHINKSRDSTKIFVNSEGLPDGASYGIVINGLGVAVNGFSNKKPNKYISKNINIVKTSVRNIIGFTHEVIALSDNPDKISSYGVPGTVQTDTAGSVFQILEVLDHCSCYKANVVSEMQLALARWSDKNLQMADPELVKRRECGKFGTLNIHSSVVAWGRNDVCYEVDVNTKISNKTKFSDIMKLFGFKFIGNGDSMFHVAKGFFGIRLDSVQKCFISAKVCCVQNIGKKGSELPGPYSGPAYGGHFAQGEMIGYTGADSYGIHISSSDQVKITKTKVSDIFSKNGSAIAIELFGETSCSDIIDSCIHNVTSCASVYTCLPNKVPIVAGIKISKDSNYITGCLSSAECISIKNGDYLANKVINNSCSAKVVVNNAK
jgi:hypothetical protein